MKGSRRKKYKNKNKREDKNKDQDQDQDKDKEKIITLCLRVARRIQQAFKLRNNP
jgi:hypothetical protein